MASHVISTGATGGDADGETDANDATLVAIRNRLPAELVDSSLRTVVMGAIPGGPLSTPLAADGDGNLLVWQMNAPASGPIQATFSGTPTAVSCSADGALNVNLAGAGTLATDTSVLAVRDRIPAQIGGATPVVVQRVANIEMSGFHYGSFAVGSMIASLDTAVSGTLAAIPFPGLSPVRARLRVVAGSLGGSSFEVFIRGRSSTYQDIYATGQLDAITGIFYPIQPFGHIVEYGFSHDSGNVPSNVTVALELEMSPGTFTAISRFTTNGVVGRSVLLGIQICPPGWRLSLKRLAWFHESASGTSFIDVPHCNSFDGFPRSASHQNILSFNRSGPLANIEIRDVCSITEGALAIRIQANNLLMHVSYTFVLERL